MRFPAVALLAIISLAAPAGPVFTNPLLPSGADPWITARDGFYYYMQTTGTNLTIWKTHDATDLKNATKKVVWTPPATGPYSHEIWAPEIHFIAGKWYIYFAADDGRNETHRIWAVENASPDPPAGEWIMKGKVSDPSDKWAIDATVFQNRDQLYLAWSGWPTDRNIEQDIYIARLKNPWTIDGNRVRISAPQYGWEKHGDLPDSRHVNVNEGPEALFHGANLFLIFSASGCWTNEYELGMLQTTTDADLMNPSSWKKSRQPVFTMSPPAHAFGTGHNGFFKSPDGKEDWIVYHSNPDTNGGCGPQRSPRAQPFGWKPDGTPDFGKPTPLGTPLPKPSGTP
jgi:GH43 family beta-xylosidase